MYLILLVQLCKVIYFFSGEVNVRESGSIVCLLIREVLFELLNNVVMGLQMSFLLKL